MKKKRAKQFWLFCAALNEGRALFPGDREFGQWVMANVLGQLAQGAIEPKEQQAAMWAAANSEQFEEARAVRGIHAKWKEIEAERKREEERAGSSFDNLSVRPNEHEQAAAVWAAANAEQFEEAHRPGPPPTYSSYVIPFRRKPLIGK